MAISSTTNWRVRAGGNNANGGGYDPAVSGVQSTTLNGAISSGATTVVVTSATGWPSSGNYYARIGTVGPEVFSSGGTGSSEVVLVTGGQGTTTWTVTRGQLGTTAQAFASGTVVDNELSRCNTAVATGTAGASTASTTFVDATFNAFNNTHIGNTLWLASGTGSPTAGVYTIQSVTNSSTVVLDRASGTYTAGVWKIGGAWSEPSTNRVKLVAGNIMYVRAGGSGTKASPDYSSVAEIWQNVGDGTNGRTRLIGENGMPYLLFSLSYPLYNAYLMTIQNLYLINPSGGSNPNFLGGYLDCDNIVVDQNGGDITNGGTFLRGTLTNVEVFSSVANAGAAGSGIGLTGDFGLHLRNCNVHDCWGIGIKVPPDSSVVECIISNNRGDGLQMNAISNDPSSVTSCTIDGNFGHGVNYLTAGAISATSMLGCIISNHTTASKYGLNTSSGTLAANDRIRANINFNWYYNNTANALNLTLGANMTTGTVNNGTTLLDSQGVDPGFTSQSTQDYSLTAASAARNMGFPQVAFPQHKSGKVGSRSYASAGGVQPSGLQPAPIVISPIQYRLTEEAA